MNKFRTFVIAILITSGMLLMSCSPQTEIPPISPKSGDPKLGSELNRLIEAESRGEAASFAQQQNISITDGNVRVIVEVLPGQEEIVTSAINAVGNIEASAQNLIQALVPVKSLTALAKEAGIKSIRLPLQPASDAGGSIK